MPRDCPLAALWTASDQLIKGESDLFSFSRINIWRNEDLCVPLQAIFIR